MAAPVAPEARKVWVVGSAPDCDIVLRHPTVAARHCLLAEYPQGFALKDLGSPYGTFVNGQRLSADSPVWVRAADAVFVGPEQPLPWPGAAKAASTPDRGRTVVQTGVWRRQITIGRSPESNQVLDYPMISWAHARLMEDHTGHLYIEDLGSTNGTSIGAPGSRIPANQPLSVSRSDDVYFGSFKIAVSRLAGTENVALGDAAAAQVELRGARTIFGRDPSCDYPLPYPMISWQHAEITREGGGMFVTDLGSRNGTYVDGARINGKTPIRPGSEIGLGSYRFTLLESGKLARRQYNGNVTIESAGLTVDIHRGGQGQRLLSPVSLTIFPSEMVAVMGPAGAGKTTFLKALNGYTAPSYGKVLFNGWDLYQFYDRFRLQLGYVPQDDIMHALLTVEEALYYTARLRTDLRDAEIRQRIVQVLTDLGIEDIAKRQIGSPEKKVISGGQRKRVNIAMELLSDPNVLFLDEPTSGLSSYDALQVVRLLRRLANGGKTIILTIHQPSTEIYKEFDNLIMVSRDKGAQSSGALAYYGPAYPESIEFFQSDGGKAAKGGELSPEMLLDGLARRTTPEWVTAYERSRFKHEFVDARTGQSPARASAGSSIAPVRGFGIGQWWTLACRNIVLKLRDRGQTLFMLLQSTLFPILVTVVFGSVPIADYPNLGDWAQYAGKITSVHFLMVVAAIWFGCNNAARDIVGELAIYQRERMVSLKLPSYLFSKAAVLAAISVAQCLLLLAIVYPVCELQAPFFATFVTLFLASQVGAALGLLISAFSSTTESAIAILPIPLLFMILLGGGIKPLHEMSSTAETLSMLFPSRWAFEANVLREASERPSWRPPPLPRVPVRPGQRSRPDGAAMPAPVPFPARDIAEQVFPRSSRSSTAACMVVLFLMAVALLGSVLVALRRRDIH